MPIEEFTTLPATPQIGFALEPAQNNFHSLVLLAKVEKASGFNVWIQDTLDTMTAQERQDHMVAIMGLHYAVRPTRSYSNFLAYVDDLAATDPLILRDRMLDAYASISLKGEPCDTDAKPPDIEKASVLASFEAYLEFLRTRFDDEHIDVEVERQAYNYAIDPPAMRSFLVAHLRHMWEHYMASEWERVKPMLTDAVNAFRQIDFTGMSNLEAAQMVTDQELEPWIKQHIEEVKHIVFVPSAHIGPYVSKFRIDEQTMGIIFGARLPKGSMVEAPDLSRHEILVRLSALADDSRLRILKHIAENGEQRSQDIMNALDLSQSAASRHLKQLSATGYLSERRCEGAKCYRLNAARLEETLNATRSFLIAVENLAISYYRERNPVHT